MVVIFKKHTWLNKKYNHPTLIVCENRGKFMRELKVNKGTGGLVKQSYYLIRKVVRTNKLLW